MKKVTPPPYPKTDRGTPRHVGVELEFIGLSAKTAAELVANALGGDPKKQDAHKYEVDAPGLGTFIIELDTIYAHKNDKPYADLVKSLNIEEDLAKLVGDVSKDFVPMEIVGPPLHWHNLNCFEKITEALRQKGAKGTNAAPHYAFGCQLNPEIVEPTAEHILSILQAFLVLEPWLREQSNKDFTRKITRFADPFPAAYQKLVLAEDYAPDLEQLIDDYLKHNPTRNRALDLLPLFKHLMPKKLKSLDDERIKARPTYHYRLPDCPLGDKTWSVHDEWARWLKVEELANTPKKLKQKAAFHAANLEKQRPIIGVTVARKGGWWMWQCNRLSIFLAGGTAKRLRPQDTPTLKGLDGLLIGGGDDISPKLYNAHLEPAVRVDEERDSIERTLAEKAMAQGMPVMGVCRGAQMLNIACGGTLHQDIYQVYKNAPKLRTVLPRKAVKAKKGSQLFKLLGVESFRVNALHHQSIDKVGEGLKATVFDNYDMVQGVESVTEHPFKIGVQWHPEFLFLVPRQRRLFKTLVKAAKAFRTAT